MEPIHEQVAQKIDAHILVAPFPTESHVNPILWLAQALAAQARILVTFAYPARVHGLARKRNQLSALQSNPMLRLQVIEDGLPLEEDESVTAPLLLASLPILHNAVKLLLHDLLHGSPPSSHPSLPPPCCIISDTFCPWAQDLADAAAIPRIDFWTGPAAVYSMGCQLPSLFANGILPLPKSCWVDLETKWTADAPLIDCVPGLPPFPVTDLGSVFVKWEDMSSPVLQMMLAAFGCARQAHTILVHSVHELEKQVFDTLQAEGYPIQAVGPLFVIDSRIESPPPSAQANNKQECLKWLDKQAPSSVMYVALGTYIKLNPAEMHALAIGLEASGHPFLWVIRRDAIEDTLENTLPQGFLQRTIEKGLGLIIPWAPQIAVLSHRSIGAFFSHCGWNSILECIWEGIPMVACPREADQRSNARWIAENWKIGVQLERQIDGSFTKEAVQRAMKEVLGEEGMQGPTYKDRALHAKKLARSAVQKGGTSHSNLATFCERICRSREL